MHWLVMHALAKGSPGWPGDVSATDLPCVHAIYMEDHRRQTMDSCKKLMVSVCIAICRLSATESYMMYKGTLSLYVQRKVLCVLRHQ